MTLTLCHPPDDSPRVVVANIPADVKSLSRWTCWRSEPDPDGGKPKKVPVNARTGRNAKISDPTTWNTFAACSDRLDADPVLSGLMIAFVADDDLMGVDLDDCVGADGTISPEADEIIKELDSYAEFSPSGQGVKILCRGHKPEGAKSKCTGQPGMSAIEVYDSKRFFTLTGRRVSGTPPEIAERQIEIDDLCARLWPPKPNAPKRGPATCTAASDEEILTHARVAKNGAAFAALFDHGDTSKYGGDESAADEALCCHLAFWTGRDPDRIDQLFRSSALMREKWDRADYRNATIQHALELVTESFGDRPSRIGTDGSPLPEIVLNAEEGRVADEVVALLARDPDLYRRGGKLVRVITLDEEGPSKPSIVVMERPFLREWITRHAVLLKETANGVKPAHPPGYIVDAILARCVWEGVRPLIGVRESPVLRPDGAVHQTLGYDQITRTLYLPSIGFPIIPEDANLDDASGALDILREPFAEFPFVSEADESAFLAGILTLVGRTAFAGPAPLTLVTANIAGAGKSLAAQCAAEIALGHGVPTSTFCGDSNESRKQISTLGLRGDPMVILDNLPGSLGNDALDRALTTTLWQDRHLGTYDNLSVPMNICWWATGNNTDIVADSMRRVIVCRLDVLAERPEERDGFKHPNLIAYIRANRMQLLVAAMTILVAFFRAGRPSQGLKPLGSFEGWSNSVRSALVWLGMPDPVSTQREIAAAANPTIEALGVMLPLMASHPASKDGFVVAELLDVLFPEAGLPTDQASRDLRHVVEGLMGANGAKRPQSASFGKRLRSLRRRVVGGLFLDHAPEGRSKAGTRWIVRRLETNP